MVQVKILKNKEKISKITFLGHSMYDTVGKDIVCSAISSIMITTINGIELLSKGDIKEKLLKDKVEIDVIYNNKIVDTLLLNMIMLLRDLEEQYPKNLKIEEEIC
jgi:hypothetical protein